MSLTILSQSTYSDDFPTLPLGSKAPEFNLPGIDGRNWTLKDFADANVPLQVKKYYLDLIEAKNSATATRGAYLNAKKWAVTAVANFDFGMGPAKDIFEALQAYSTMRADFFKSIYNYRIAAAGLDYATSEPLHDHAQ